MKRFLVTAFTLLYTVALILGASDRTAAWAAQKASAAERKALGPGLNAGKSATPHHPNRRIVPSHFVVEPPVAESGIALASAPLGLHFKSTPVRLQAGPPTPSRAPPQA
jgi:hypothetical protein